MLYDYLKRGTAAGILAGTAYGLFMALVLNPLVSYIDHLGHGGGHEAAHEPASAVATNAVGVGSGVLWGILLGAVFGALYYLVEPSLPGGAGTRPYVLAGAGLFTVSGAPWLALPPVAPGTEQAMATDTRLLLYGGMMLVGATVSVLAVVAFYRLREQRIPTALGAALACLLLVATPLTLVSTGGVAGVPTTLAVAFRWLVVFSQVGLWGLIAAAYVRLDRWTDDSPTVSAARKAADERSTGGT